MTKKERQRLGGSNQIFLATFKIEKMQQSIIDVRELLQQVECS